MFSVNGDTINLTRGDTGILEISLVDGDGNPYIPIEGDRLRFAMKKKFTDPDCLILKQIPLDTMLLEIKPEDTKSLAFSRYVYDIEFTDSVGHVSTVILGEFNVTKEVH